MDTNKFLDNLEKMNLVRVEIINKLRYKVSKTDKHVSAESIAKYLIDKGVLSKYQANQLLSDDQEFKEDIDVVVPKDEIDDTNELLKDLNVGPAAAQPTTSPESDVAVIDVAEAVEPAVEVVDVEHEMTMQYGADPNAMPMHDPLGTELDQMPYGGEGAEEPEPLGSFAGKKAVKNQWDSKWIFIGSGLLAFLIMAGIILGYTLFRTDVDKMWEAAEDDFNKSNYQTAIDGYHKFIDSYPSDPRVPTAKVRIANCELRIPYDSKRWETTLTRIKNVLPKLQEDLDYYEKPESFEDIRDELSVIIPGTAFGFTEEGLEEEGIEGKQNWLDFAIEAFAFVDNSAYVPTSRKQYPGVVKVLEDVENNIALIRRQIQMEKDYAAALTKIDELTTQGETNQAFETYESLTRLYSELQIREPLIEAMSKVSLREAELVTVADFSANPSASPDSIIQSTVVVSTKTGVENIPGLVDEMVVYLINGAIYGFGATDGVVRWREYVGVETTTIPQWLNPDSKQDIIATDARGHDLMRIRASDGETAWRISIGEPFANPFVSPEWIVVTTLSGKVIKVDAQDGSTSQSAQLPQNANISGVLHDAFIFQVGEHSNLYIISAADMQCKEVVHLSHDRGAIAAPPLMLSGHLIIPINGAGYCNLLIFKPTENGLKYVEAQQSIRLDGEVKAPFTRYNRWALVMSDEGDLRMLEVNLADEEEPVTVVADGQFSRAEHHRHYMLAESSYLWTAGSGMRQYKIQKQVGQFRREQLTNNLDIFLGPLFKYGDTLFHIRQRNDSALISVSAVDSKTHKQIWRTDFSAPLAGPPIKNGDGVYVVSSQGDLFKVDQQSFDSGVTGDPISRGSTVVQNLIFDHIVPFSEQNHVAVGPVTRRSILSLDMSMTPPSKLSDLQPPADQPSCRPVAFGSALLVPSLRGQVFRINTRSGKAVGAPFQPPLEPNVDIRWQQPAVIDDNMFMIADSTGKFFLVVADGQESLQKQAEYVHDGSVLAPLVKMGDSIFAICREGLSDKILQIPVGQTIEVIKNLELPGGYVAGPMVLADGVAVVVDSGKLVHFDSQLEQTWSVDLPNDKLVGAPTVIGNSVILAFESGLLGVVNAQDGTFENTYSLGQPISSPPVTIDGQLYVSGADGTVHRFEIAPSGQ